MKTILTIKHLFTSCLTSHTAHLKEVQMITQYSWKSWKSFRYHLIFWQPFCPFSTMGFHQHCTCFYLYYCAGFHLYYCTCFNLYYHTFSLNFLLSSPLKLIWAPTKSPGIFVILNIPLTSPLHYFIKYSLGNPLSITDRA